MLKRIAAAMLLASALPAAAQQAPAIPRCGFELIWKNLEGANPGFRAQYDAQFATAGTASKPTGDIYYIPVVFHVLYNTPAENLPDSVIQNQIAVLNGAYRKQHADVGAVRGIFQPISADAEIEFYLATADPDGNPTTGITRTATTYTTFLEPFSFFAGDFSSVERAKSTAEGGHDAWPTSRYLNIWSVDMSLEFGGTSNPFLFGYATPPLNPLPANWGTDPAGLDLLKDGVMLQYQTVGSNNPNAADLEALNVFSEGRTAVHEVGHYLGLRHIWGDPADSTAACTAMGDDGIADTPPQAEESANNGSCPSNTQNTCGAGAPGDQPDNWENYMDYSSEPCQAMFTEGQVAHMRQIAGNQRDSLTSTSAPTAVAGIRYLPLSLAVFPQPANEVLSLHYAGNIDALTITNAIGQVALVADGAAVNASRKVDINSLPAGVYQLSIRDCARTVSKRISVMR